MKIFNIEIRKVLPADQEMKRGYLEKAEQNAKLGLIQANLELTHHELLLEQAPKLNRTEAEIKGYEDAIERDHKTINNFQTQLKAISYERN
jgi:hypothetical protein